jgi:phosphoribosylformylglycinamidine cyclo-ligase
MLRTFNCGIGMAIVVRADGVAALERALTAAGEQVHRIGIIEPGNRDGPGIVIG